METFGLTNFVSWVEPQILADLAVQARNAEIIDKKLTIDDIIFTQYKSILK